MVTASVAGLGAGGAAFPAIAAGVMSKETRAKYAAPGFFEKYKWYVLGGLGVVAVGYLALRK